MLVITLKLIVRSFNMADDISLKIQGKNLHTCEATMENDLNVQEEYFHTWNLQINPTKTEVAPFHLNNRLSNTDIIC